MSWSDEEEKIDKNYLIGWNGAEYTVEEFFRAAFPEYKKFSKRCVFGDDVRRLSPNQRAKLQYDALAVRYGLTQVDDADREALALFCAAHQDVSTFNRLLTRLGWKNGIEKMVTFGATLRADESAVKTAWCYRVDKDERRAAYTGAAMTWDRWMDGIENAACEASNSSSTVGEKQAYIAVYYQGGMYMALPRTAADKLKAWVAALLAGFNTSRPEAAELGELRGAGIGFEVVYADVKIVDSVDLRSSENMAAWNVERGKQMVIERAGQTLANYKSGDKITTKELNGVGYSKNTIPKLIKNGIVKRIRNGLYEVV